MTDWAAWHAPYDDPGSPLAQRLQVVRQQVALALDRAPAGPVRLLSLCAGQGADVLPLLGAHPRGRDVRGRLVELDARNVEVARSRAPRAVEVVQGDAGSSDACAGAVPAGLLLLCGIFGNVSDDDVERTVAAVPQLCARGAAVVWTRSTHAPDLTPAVRRWFARAGVVETAFVTEGPEGWSVGAGTFTGDPEPLVAGRRLFTFTTRPPGQPERAGATTVADADDAAREQLAFRLRVMDALCAAQERRAEVMTVVASSQDAAEAAARLVRLLDLPDEVGATAVLDLQVRGWTRQEHERMEQVRAELRAELGAP